MTREGNSGRTRGEAPVSGGRSRNRGWSLAAGLLIFTLFVLIGGRESLTRLGHVRPLPMVGAVLMTLAITGSIAFRWGTVVNGLSGFRAASWFRYYHYFMTGRFFGFFLPKDITDIANRTLMLARNHQVPLSRAAASVLIDRAGDLLAMMVLLPATLPFWFGWIPGWQGVALMLGLALFAALPLYLFHSRVAGMIRLVLRSADAIAKRFPRIGSRFDGITAFPDLERRILLTYYLASILKVLWTALRFVFYGLALGIPIPVSVLILGTPVSQLGYMVSFTPGGLGIFEAGWFGLLILAGGAAEQASAFVVGQRILTAAIITVLTFLSHTLYNLRSDRDEGPR